MKNRNWTTIDAAVDKLDSLIGTVNLPGDHPAIVRGIEECIQIITGADVAIGPCAELRTAAYDFYAVRSRRSWPMSEVEYRYWQVRGAAESVREHIRMVKAAETTDAK